MFPPSHSVIKAVPATRANSWLNFMNYDAYVSDLVCPDPGPSSSRGPPFLFPPKVTFVLPVRACDRVWVCIRAAACAGLGWAGGGGGGAACVRRGLLCVVLRRFINTAGGCNGASSHRAYVRSAVVPESFRPASCADVAAATPALPAGIYTLYPPSGTPFQVRGGV